MKSYSWFVGCKGTMLRITIKYLKIMKLLCLVSDAIPTKNEPLKERKGVCLLVSIAITMRRTTLLCFEKLRETAVIINAQLRNDVANGKVSCF